MARLGEFERIDRYFKPLAAEFEGSLELSDDAALLPVPPGETVVVTTDAMVEGVHYLAGEDPGRVARKALRVNLSDLAAMGARPLAYLLTTALPGSVDDDWLAAFAAGLGDDQERYGIHLAGGDSVSTPGPATISVTAFGAVPEGLEIRRSGARPGDRVWVSGTIGDGALGLLAARGELKTLSLAHREYLAGRYYMPSPRLALGERLRGIASAAADVSDGLLGDLGHICAASGVGATLMAERVPQSPAVQAAAVDPKSRVLAWAGGDDYELLFTAAADATAAVNLIAREIDLPVTCIGEVVSGSDATMLDAAGNPVALPPAWQHFSSE